MWQMERANTIIFKLAIKRLVMSPMLRSAVILGHLHDSACTLISPKSRVCVVSVAAYPSAVCLKSTVLHRIRRIWDRT